MWTFLSRSTYLQNSRTHPQEGCVRRLSNYQYLMHYRVLELGVDSNVTFFTLDTLKYPYSSSHRNSYPQAESQPHILALLLEQGVDIRYIQTLLGHNYPKTAAIYAFVSDKSLRKIKSPLDNCFVSLDWTDSENK